MRLSLFHHFILFLVLFVPEIWDRSSGDVRLGGCDAFLLTTTTSAKTPLPSVSILPLSSLSSSSGPDDEKSMMLTTTTGQEDPIVPKRKVPLSPKEILARQRGGDDEDDAYPKLFEDNLLDDMREMLLLLEKRVTDGPGSLTAQDVERFSTMSQGVLTEMKEKEYSRLLDAGNATSKTTISTPTTLTTTTSTTVASSPPPTTSTTAVAVGTTATVPDSTSRVEVPPVMSTAIDAQSSVVASSSSKVEDLEDGPAYSPSGGNGSLARGTVNTYVIPNMDEMSPEEYQKALQDSISERQRQRVASGQLYGNRATWDYLNHLSGDSGVLKKATTTESSSSSEHD